MNSFKERERIYQFIKILGNAITDEDDIEQIKKVTNGKAILQFADSILDDFASSIRQDLASNIEKTIKNEFCYAYKAGIHDGIHIGMEVREC